MAESFERVALKKSGNPRSQADLVSSQSETKLNNKLLKDLGTQLNSNQRQDSFQKIQAQTKQETPLLKESRKQSKFLQGLKESGDESLGVAKKSSIGFGLNMLGLDKGGQLFKFEDKLDKLISWDTVKAKKEKENLDTESEQVAKVSSKGQEELMKPVILHVEQLVQDKPMPVEMQGGGFFAVLKRYLMGKGLIKIIRSGVSGLVDDIAKSLGDVAATLLQKSARGLYEGISKGLVGGFVKGFKAGLSETEFQTRLIDVSEENPLQVRDAELALLLQNLSNSQVHQVSEISELAEVIETLEESVQSQVEAVESVQTQTQVKAAKGEPEGESTVSQAAKMAAGSGSASSLVSGAGTVAAGVGGAFSLGGVALIVATLLLLPKLIKHAIFGVEKAPERFGPEYTGSAGQTLASMGGSITEAGTGAVADITGVEALRVSGQDATMALYAGGGAINEVAGFMQGGQKPTDVWDKAMDNLDYLSGVKGTETGAEIEEASRKWEALKVGVGALFSGTPRVEDEGVNIPDTYNKSIQTNKDSKAQAANPAPILIQQSSGGSAGGTIIHDSLDGPYDANSMHMNFDRLE